MIKKNAFKQELKLMTDEEVKQVAGGLLGPDDDFSKIPPRYWPVVFPEKLLTHILPDIQVVRTGLAIH